MRLFGLQRSTARPALLALCAAAALATAAPSSAASTPGTATIAADDQVADACDPNDRNNCSNLMLSYEFEGLQDRMVPPNDEVAVLLFGQVLVPPSGCTILGPGLGWTAGHGFICSTGYKATLRWTMDGAYALEKGAQITWVGAGAFYTLYAQGPPPDTGDGCDAGLCPYKISFYSAGALNGLHGSVQFVDQNGNKETVGRWFTGNFLVEQAVFGTVTGFRRDDGDLPWAWRITYHVSKDDFDAAHAYAFDDSHTRNYNLFFLNCVDFLQEVAAAAHITLPDFTDYDAPFFGPFNLLYVPDGHGMNASLVDIYYSQGGSFHGGVVTPSDGTTMGGAPDPPTVPDPGGPGTLAQAALADPSGTADVYALAYSTSTLPTAHVAAGATFDLTESPSGDVTSSTITAIDWGDGTPPDYSFQETPWSDGPLVVSHVYDAAGTYSDRVVVVENGALAVWEGSVVVGAAGAGAQAFTVPAPGPLVRFQELRFRSSPPADAAVGGTYALDVTGGDSGNPVVFGVDASSTDGACSISGATVTFTGLGTCVVDADQAGNQAFRAAPRAQQAIAVTVPAAADAIAPVVAWRPAGDSCSLPGGNGWCRGVQTASFHAEDEGSGLAGPADFTRSTSTEGQAVTIPSGAVCDLAGNCGASVDAGPYRIDATAPVVAYAGNAGTYGLTDVVAISCTATDGVSGVASSTCAGVDAAAWTLGAGSHTLSAGAADAAGNSAAGSTSFTVTVTAGGLCRLTTQFLEASPKYRALGAAARSLRDAVARALCDQLARSAGTVPGPVKAALVKAYALAVTALARGGWLTTGQAATLSALAARLSRPGAGALSPS